MTSWPNEHSWALLETHPLQELWEKQQLYAVWEIQDLQPLLERWWCSRQVMTFLAAPDQKVALLVTPGWANAVPVLPVLPVLWSPQEPKQSLLMLWKSCYDREIHVLQEKEWAQLGPKVDEKTIGIHLLLEWVMALFISYVHASMKLLLTRILSLSEDTTHKMNLLWCTSQDSCFQNNFSVPRNQHSYHSHPCSDLTPSLQCHSQHSQIQPILSH